MSFAVQAPPNPPVPSPPLTTNAPPTCTHCGRIGHDFERCYQRIGFPPGRGRGRGATGSSRGQQSQQLTLPSPPVSQTAEQGPRQTNSSTPPGFSNDQVQRLINLLESASSSETFLGKDTQN